MNNALIIAKGFNQNLMLIIYNLYLDFIHDVYKMQDQLHYIYTFTLLSHNCALILYF